MIDKAVSKAFARFGRTEWLLWRHANAGHAVASIEPLSVEQVQAIQRTMCDKHPEQLKMDFFMWSRVPGMQLIEREYGPSSMIG